MAGDVGNAGNVVDRLLGIELGALAADLVENVDEMRLDIEQTELEYGEKPHRTRADNENVGFDGLTHLYSLQSSPCPFAQYPRATASRNPFLIIQCGGNTAGPAGDPRIWNFDQTQEFRDILFGGAAAGQKGHVGLGVKRLAAAQNGDEILHRARAVGHRAHVALRHHAFHVLFRRGLHPDREAGREQKLERTRLGDDAARRRDHEAFVPAQHVVERLALGAPEGLLAEHVENLAQGGAAALLDLAVKLDEGQAEPLRGELAERRFAAAAQADQRDAVTARVVGWLAEVAQQEIARF